MNPNVKVRLDADLIRKLQARAEQDDRTVSWLIRQAVRAMLDGKGERKR